MTPLSKNVAAVAALVLTVALALAGALAAEDAAQNNAKADAPKPEADKKPEPKTHTVRKETFTIHLNLSGAFDSKQVATYRLRPQQWGSWKVKVVVPHGTRVKKGQPVIEFDATDLEAAIEDFEAAQAIADLEYQAAQQDLNWVEQTVPMDLAAAERNKEYFDEDYKRYHEVELPLSKELAAYNVRILEQTLTYELEELKQLEKMYKADDLTEETEEIILERQRNVVDRLKFNLERARLTRDHTLETLLPREEKQTELNARLAELRLQSARLAYPRTLAQKRLAVKKLTRDRGKAQEQLKKLRQDRAAMQVRSPIDGIVYYGDDNRGQFTGVAAAAAMLDPGDAVKPHFTLLTIVAPAPLVVRTTVAEASLRFAKPGVAGHATPTAFPDRRLDAKIESVAAVPLTPGQFDAVIAINGGKPAAGVVPGMTAAVRLTAYEKKNALTVPTGLVHREDDGGAYVYVLKNTGEAKKQPVTTGEFTSDKTEITKGLAEGDKVLLEKPKD